MAFAALESGSASLSPDPDQHQFLYSIRKSVLQKLTITVVMGFVIEEYDQNPSICVTEVPRRKRLL